MESLRIAFITREYPPETLWGGEATVYSNLAQCLAQRGFEVHVICQAIGAQRTRLEGGVHVHRVGTDPKQLSAIARVNFSLYAWSRVRDLLRRRSLHLVQAPFWSADGFLYSLKRSTPLLVTTQSSPHDAIRTKTYPSRKVLLGLHVLSRLADFTARRADLVVATSVINRDEMLNRVKVHAAKLRLVHLSVDTFKYKPTESHVREELGLSRDVPLALFVGRLEAKKGLQVLCDAIPRVVARVPTLTFALVGQDTRSGLGGVSFRKYLTNRAHEQGFSQNLILTGALAPEDVIRFYSACDVFVCPSLEESFGLVVVEAMACGKPVVATLTGIVPELKPYLLPGLFAVPVGDAEALAQAIIKAVALQDEDRLRITMQHRDFVVQNFSMDRQVEAMCRIYEELRFA